MTNAAKDIAERISEALKQGTVPWTCPFIGGAGVARNLKTKRPYRGLNVLLLALSPHAGQWFVTFKQAKAMGGTVRKGEHGTKLYFWTKWCFKHKCDARKCSKQQHELRDRALIQKGFTVFNAETQCDGLSVPAGNAVRRASGGHELGLRLLDLLDRGGYELPVSEASDGAYYIPAQHRVNIPPTEAFPEGARSYYQTCLHELAHSTGKALERQIENPFGSQEYAREELTAEMTACMGMIELGTEPDIENSAAYCENWMQRLEDDPNLITVAAGRAAKALACLFDGENEEQS